MRVVLTGGATGGHLMPFEPIISSLRQKFLEEQSTLPKSLGVSELEIMFTGIGGEEAEKFFATYDVPVIHIPSGKLRRYVSGLTIIDLLFRLPVGILIALVRMYMLMPDIVVSKGGYGSIPTVIAAWWYRIPVLFHESDTVPGMTNRRLARLARIITAGFAEAKDQFGSSSYKVFITGTPVRADLTSIDKGEAKKSFDIPESERVLLVTGGSQGAKQLNESVLEILPELIAESAIIHITGKDHFPAVSTVAAEILEGNERADLYKPYPYLTDQMSRALVAADAAVARAGASTLAELIRLRTPSLIVPLDSSAADHQRKNAQVLENAGAAIVLDPSNLSRGLFLKNMARIILHEDSRNHLKKGMEALDRPEAAKKIAALVFKLARGFAPTK